MVVFVDSKTIVCYDTKNECCLHCNEPNDYSSSAAIIQGGLWESEDVTDTFRICKYCERTMMDSEIRIIVLKGIKYQAINTNHLDILYDCDSLILNNKKYHIQVIGDSS
jgi:hypothetical protein